MYNVGKLGSLEGLRMAYCTGCGVELDGRGEYCPKCGLALAHKDSVSEKRFFPSVLWLLPLVFAFPGGLIAAFISGLVYKASWWELFTVGVIVSLIWVVLTVGGIVHLFTL
jgi:hypothetical protein